MGLPTLFEGENSAASNSGVFRSAGIDWLTFSMPRAGEHFEETLRKVSKQFVLMPEEQVSSGHGYVGYVLACYGSLTARGADIKVDLPGLAMQYVRTNLEFQDEEVIGWFLQRGFKATRIDIALDTDHPQFNPLVAFRAWKSGLTRSDASMWDFRLSKMQRGRQIFPRDGKGMTTYVGSPKSLRRVRIYDRKALLEKYGEIATDPYGRELQRVTRIELQARKEAAEFIAREVVQHGDSIIPALIGSYLKFLDPADERERQRKDIAPYWLEIIGPVVKDLPRLRTPTPPDKTKLWLDKQVAPSLKVVKVFDRQRFDRLMGEKVPLAEISSQKRKRWEACELMKRIGKEEVEAQEREEREERVLDRLVGKAVATVAKG